MDFGEKQEKLISSQKAHIIVNGVLTKHCAIQKGTRQGYFLCSLLFIFTLKALNRNLRQDERVAIVKIKKEIYKLQEFVDDLEDFSEGIETLMEKLNEFGISHGFKINKQKVNILTKYMNIKKQKEQMGKNGFKIEEK